jgi:hypothetical protein
MTSAGPGRAISSCGGIYGPAGPADAGAKCMKWVSNVSVAILAQVVLEDPCSQVSVDAAGTACDYGDSSGQEPAPDGIR